MIKDKRPTGDPLCPEPVRRAKRANRRIEELLEHTEIDHCGFGDGGADEPDDGDWGDEDGEFSEEDQDGLSLPRTCFPYILLLTRFRFQNGGLNRVPAFPLGQAAVAAPPMQRAQVVAPTPGPRLEAPVAPMPRPRPAHGCVCNAWSSAGPWPSSDHQGRSREPSS
jgi:hypothetical protein